MASTSSADSLTTTCKHGVIPPKTERRKIRENRTINHQSVKCPYKDCINGYIFNSMTMPCATCSGSGKVLVKQVLVEPVYEEIWVAGSCPRCAQEKHRKYLAQIESNRPCCNKCKRKFSNIALGLLLLFIAIFSWPFLMVLNFLLYLMVLIAFCCCGRGWHNEYDPNKSCCYNFFYSMWPKVDDLKELIIDEICCCCSSNQSTESETLI